MCILSMCRIILLWCKSIAKQVLFDKWDKKGLKWMLYAMVYSHGNRPSISGKQAQICIRNFWKNEVILQNLLRVWKYIRLSIALRIRNWSNEMISIIELAKPVATWLLVIRISRPLALKTGYKLGHEKVFFYMSLHVFIIICIKTLLSMLINRMDLKA